MNSISPSASLASAVSNVSLTSSTSAAAAAAAPQEESYVQMTMIINSKETLVSVPELSARMISLYPPITLEEDAFRQSLIPLKIYQKLDRLVSAEYKLGVITSVTKELFLFLQSPASSMVRVPKDKDRFLTITLNRSNELIHIGILSNSENKTRGKIGAGTYKVVKEAVRIIVACAKSESASTSATITVKSVDNAAAFRLKKGDTAEKTKNRIYEFLSVQDLLSFALKQVNHPQSINSPSSFFRYPSKNVDVDKQRFERLEGLEDRFDGDLQALGVVGVSTIRGGVSRLYFPHRLECLSEATVASAEFHDNGMVHCDLKPQNLLVKLMGDKFICKLSDHDLLDFFSFKGNGEKVVYDYWDLSAMEGKFTPNCDTYAASLSAVELYIPNFRSYAIFDGVPLVFDSSEYDTIFKEILLKKIKTPDTTYPIGEEIKEEIISRIGSLTERNDLASICYEVIKEYEEKIANSKFFTGFKFLKAEIFASLSTLNIFVKEVKRSRDLYDYLEKEKDGMAQTDYLINYYINSGNQSSVPDAIKVAKGKWEYIKTQVALTSSYELAAEFKGIADNLHSILRTDPKSDSGEDARV